MCSRISHACSMKRGPTPAPASAVSGSRPGSGLCTRRRRPDGADADDARARRSACPGRWGARCGQDCGQRRALRAKGLDSSEPTGRLELPTGGLRRGVGHAQRRNFRRISTHGDPRSIALLRPDCCTECCTGRASPPSETARGSGPPDECLPLRTNRRQPVLALHAVPAGIREAGEGCTISALVST